MQAYIRHHRAVRDVVGEHWTSAVATSHAKAGRCASIGSPGNSSSSRTSHLAHWRQACSDRCGGLAPVQDTQCQRVLQAIACVERRVREQTQSTGTDFYRSPVASWIPHAEAAFTKLGAQVRRARDLYTEQDMDTLADFLAEWEQFGQRHLAHFREMGATGTQSTLHIRTRSTHDRAREQFGTQHGTQHLRQLRWQDLGCRDRNWLLRHTQHSDQGHTFETLNEAPTLGLTWHAADTHTVQQWVCQRVQQEAAHEAISRQQLMPKWQRHWTQACATMRDLGKQHARAWRQHLGKVDLARGMLAIHHAIQHQPRTQATLHQLWTCRAAGAQALPLAVYTEGAWLDHLERRWGQVSSSQQRETAFWQHCVHYASRLPAAAQASSSTDSESLPPEQESLLPGEEEHLGRLLIRLGLVVVVGGDQAVATAPLDRMHAQDGLRPVEEGPEDPRPVEQKHAQPSSQEREATTTGQASIFGQPSRDWMPSLEPAPHSTAAKPSWWHPGPGSTARLGESARQLTIFNWAAYIQRYQAALLSDTKAYVARTDRWIKLTREPVDTHESPNGSSAAVLRSIGGQEAVLGETEAAFWQRRARFWHNLRLQLSKCGPPSPSGPAEIEQAFREALLARHRRVRQEWTVRYGMTWVTLVQRIRRASQLPGWGRVCLATELAWAAGELHRNQLQMYSEERAALLQVEARFVQHQTNLKIFHGLWGSLVQACASQDRHLPATAQTRTWFDGEARTRVGDAGATHPSRFNVDRVVRLCTADFVPTRAFGDVANTQLQASARLLRAYSCTDLLPAVKGSSPSLAEASPPSQAMTTRIDQSYQLATTLGKTLGRHSQALGVQIPRHITHGAPSEEKNGWAHAWCKWHETEYRIGFLTNVWLP